MLEHSSYSDSQHVYNFRQTMNNLKSPYLQKINITKHMFHQKIEKFEENIHIDIQDESYQEVQKQQLVINYRQSQLDTQQNINQKQNIQQIRLSQAKSPSKISKKNKISELPFNFMKEWTASNGFAFSNIQQAKQSFVNVFHKKLSVKKKNKKERNYDFKEDQKEMLLNIFHQLQYSDDKGFASIDRILDFFEKNSLFYLFYNLHPNRIKYEIKEFARTRPDSLSQKQFLFIFYLDRPLLKDLSDPYEKVVNRKCIMDSEGWQEMKNIFDTLDTFGNETIHIYPFFKKLKVYHTNPSLIFTPVIEFPEIDRIYTLKKVVFDLENKFSFDLKMKWADIQNLIINFNHKQEPTLDVIFEKQLEKGTILLDSNYFLIDKKVIELLKNIFERCPKFSQFFVNTKFICQQILENIEIKQFFNNFIRQRGTINGGYINFQEATRLMATKAPQYIDLDEFLEYYSIKGPITNVLMDKSDQITSTDQDKEDHDEKVKLLKRVRSLQKLQNSKKDKKSKKLPKQITDVQQFNLTKKQTETIRERKVKQMLQQKQEQELNQLKKKFKANPIPADLNPQRLKEEQKRNQMRKRKKFQEVAKRRQEEKQILSYLKANTKLFEPLNKENQQQRKQANELALKPPPKPFTHKPVPWFVQQNMLQKIEKEKQERKKKIFEEARIKYVRSWNHLPDFFFKDEEQQNSAEDSLIKVLKKTHQQKPKVVIRANPVPDFKSLQKQFEEQLQSKKKSFQPTQIEEFRLTSPNASRKTHCNFLSPQVKVSKKSDWRKTINSPPQNKIATTKKTEDWMNHNRKMQEQKRLVLQEEKIREKQRLTKQKNFAKFMSRKLRQQDKYMPDLGAQTAQKLRRHKETVQYLQRLTQKQLSQIYGRVLQRPFLFQIANQQQSIQKSQKPKKKGTKTSKKRVIKNIDAIDMSEQSSNNYHQQMVHNVNYNNQYEDNDGEQYYDEQDNNQYGSNQESSRQHHGLNQSF